MARGTPEALHAAAWSTPKHSHVQPHTARTWNTATALHLWLEPAAMPSAYQGELGDAAVQGMLQAEALGRFYKDLKNPLTETAFAVYHRRFSTNTTPKWPLAQPMRVLGHNGASCLCLSCRCALPLVHC